MIYIDDQIDKVIARWDKMATAWNQGIAKDEEITRNSKVTMFVKLANNASTYMRAAAKICCQKT